MARTFVLTGDPKFERMYWEILAIRNGAAPRPHHYERIHWDLVAGQPGLKSKRSFINTGTPCKGPVSAPPHHVPPPRYPGPPPPRQGPPPATPPQAPRPGVPPQE